MLSVCWGVVLNVCLKLKTERNAINLIQKAKRIKFPIYLHHEPDCTKNHEWSSKIGLFLDYIENILLF